jgi:hypothetical protein
MIISDSETCFCYCGAGCIGGFKVRLVYKFPFSFPVIL